MAAAREQWVHMVGIAGAGMSGIARVLAEQGYKVSGSDLQSNSVTRKLLEIGVDVYNGHSSSYVREGVDCLVISSAIPQDNPEVIMARENNIPVLSRGQMLANLVNKKKGIAVAGAHGKTTTTSMIYLCLSHCGMDPTFIVGGELQGSRLNACLGSGDCAVVEADESDASFLELNPFIAVITNIEDDHLDYYKTVENIRMAFRQFIDQVNPHGFAVLYGEDQYNQVIKEMTSTPVITYGEDTSNDYYMLNWQSYGMISSFDVYQQGNMKGRVELSVPGKHNALNALAAISIALELGCDLTEVKKAVKDFKGTGRRFEITGSKNDITIIDDYAHHPTEIKVTIEAARKVHNGRLIVIFQPHRYSRTQILGKQLGEALQGADLVLVTDVYSAGEEPLAGINGEIVYKVANEARCDAVYVPTFDDAKTFLLKNVRQNDMLITMGAGDIWKIGVDLLKKL